MNAKSLRAARGLLVISLALLTSMVGCSSEDGGTGPETPGQQSGVFLDSAVENLDFETVTSSGKTDQDGSYTYYDGELITFSIGTMDFPTIAASALTTPLSLAGSQSVLDQTTTNIARLLQTLDEDGDPSNGIRIPNGAAAVASPIDFALETSAFEASTAVMALVSGAGGVNATLITEEAAQMHLDETIDNLASSVIGAWSATDGPYFSHIVLLADGTFVYGENDEFGTGPGENGLEVGTYEYDPIAGNATFTLAYDDNAPGNDSGIGDIGTPAVISALVTNGGASLLVSDGELVLNTASLASDSGIAGAWSLNQASGFAYLVLYANGTFLYAENDLEAVGAEENGLEVGSYVYNSVSGDITFTIVYDDNAPGNDSGVGDIGTAKVIGGQLSNQNNTLTAAGGELVFTREL